MTSRNFRSAAGTSIAPQTSRPDGSAIRDWRPTGRVAPAGASQGSGQASGQPSVVILKAVPGLLLHGALGVARSLGRMGVSVYAFQDAAWTPIALSRYVRVIPWSFGKEGPIRTLERLRELASGLAERPILIPADDVATLFVADHAGELRPKFRFPDQPEGLARKLANKKELYDLCKQWAVPTPEIALPRSIGDVQHFAEGAAFPVVVKSCDPELLNSRKSARSVSIVNDASELLEAYQRMEDPEHPNLMLQEFIPGESESIWMFNGYFDHESDCLFGICGQKLRQFPRKTGATSLGRAVENVTVQRQTRHFLKSIGYRGIVDLGYRFDARDGQYKLLDVNPRIGATFRLFVDDNGLDVARALYLDMIGEHVPAMEFTDGRTWMVDGDDLLTYLMFYRRTAGLGDWLRNLAGATERAWFAADDPLPFLGMSLSFPIKAAYKCIKGF